jgi:YVTN family beta-propeller protein
MPPTSRPVPRRPAARRRAAAALAAAAPALAALLLPRPAGAQPAAGAAAGGAVAGGAAPTSARPYSLYVSSESGDRVSHVRVDSAGWRVVREVPVALSPTDRAGPHNVSVAPDGRFWYVSIAHGKPFGAVWKFAAGTDSLVGRAPVGMFPTTIGLAPDGEWAYVPNSDFHGDRGRANTVSVIWTPEMRTVAELPACDMPHGSRWNGAGTTVYIACMMSDELVTIDAGAMRVARRVPLGSGRPMSMAAHLAAEARADSAAAGAPAGAPAGAHGDHAAHAAAAPPRRAPGAASSTMPGQNPDCLTTYVSVSPDDRRLYLACNHANELQVRDAATLALVGRVATGAGAYNVEPSPDGRLVLVTNKKAQSVSIIDAATLRELARVPTSKKVPHGIAFSPDGRLAFVTCESQGTDPGAVDAIDLAARRRVASLPIPLQPTGIARWDGPAGR